jgi:predicted N-formylglutamate amidohydrolase
VHSLRRLLEDDEPEPVVVERESGASPVFLTCDHAGRRLPRRLGDLGVDHKELQRHIAWDIGAFAVARRISEALDATLVAQIYSRLVIDCNRQPGTEPSIPVISEHTRIPGNVGIDEAEKKLRQRELHDPYHGTITRLLDAREKADRPSILVAIHSMTPIFDRVHRPWHISFSCDEERSIVDRLLSIMRSDPDLHVGDNEPYKVSVVDYTIPTHGTDRGLPRVLVELRQDLVTYERGQKEWADRLSSALLQVLEEAGTA